MVCAWQELINILPPWMRLDIDKLFQYDLQEIRLRLGQSVFLKFKNTGKFLERKVSATDMRHCINIASKYSPWLANSTDNGYITAPGGHRIGVCGDMHGASGTVTDLGGITSLCIRIARDYPGIASKIPCKGNSILIIGKPGSGKTTLLRDLIRNRSGCGIESVAVVDERVEIFPRVNGLFCFDIGTHTDVLSLCKKAKGIEAVLRAMGPDTIAIDEITADEDCKALFHAAWCGVKLIATAHAGNCKDLLSRPLYRPIVENKIFDTIVVLDKNQTWHIEELNL